MRQCEVCKTEIPDDYQNLLCDKCYKLAEEENARKRAIDGEEKKKDMKDQEGDKNLAMGQIDPKNGISDPNYKENPEKEDKEQWQANFTIFVKNGVILWKPTRSMYEFIKTEQLNSMYEFIKTEQLNRITQHPQYPKFIWRPKIVDVGCGIGVGSNILSQEADFVWGIDKNKKSVEFAKQCFTRTKNNIYYSAQVSFDEIDILEDTREFLKFDVVVAIEVIEHLYDYKKFLETLIMKFDKRSADTPTTYYISTPNRNNKSIQKDRPKNIYHVREFTSEEYWDILSNYFTNIEFFASDGKPTERSTEHTPLLAKVSNPKI